MLVLPDHRYLRFPEAVQRSISCAWERYVSTGRDEWSSEVEFTPGEVADGAPLRIRVPDPHQESWVPLRVEISSSRSSSRPFLVLLKGDGVVESFFLPSAASRIPPGAVAAIFSVDRRLRCRGASRPGRTALTPPHDLSLPPEHWLVASVHAS
jgi:hypothetical protein